MTPEEKKRRHRNERIAAAILVLVLVTGTVGLARYRKQLEDDVRRDRMYIPKNTQFSPELSLLQEYLKIDTSNPPGNELPAAQWLSAQLAQAGITAEIIESAPRRANVYARLKGKRPGEGLLLLHHMDVIPATSEGWKRPPFAGEIHMNEVYGRGALDMKATGICFLRAFLDAAKAGRAPERDIVFLAVADEETGSDFGMRWLIANRPDVIDGIRYALNEGGITEMLKEKVTYYGIEIGTKLTVTLFLEANTREQLQKLRIALSPWFISRKPQRVMPEVRRWMKDLAPQRLSYETQLEDIDRAIANGRFWSLPVGYREMAQNGVWAEAITKSGKGYQMRVYLFNLPDEDPQKRMAWLAERSAPFGVTLGRVTKSDGPAPISSIDNAFYRLLTSHARRAYEGPTGTEILNQWQNDSRFLRPRGIEAYGINPFPVDFFQSESIHSINERVRTDFFNRGVQFSRDLVMDYAFSE